MQLGGGAIEKCLCVCDIENGYGYEHVQGWFLEQIVEEGGLFDGQLLEENEKNFNIFAISLP